MIAPGLGVLALLAGIVVLVWAQDRRAAAEREEALEEMRDRIRRVDGWWQ